MSPEIEKLLLRWRSCRRHDSALSPYDVGNELAAAVRRLELQVTQSIGEGPGAAGFTWDKQRRGWLRFWEGTFIAADDAPQWYAWEPE